MMSGSIGPGLAQRLLHPVEGVLPFTQPTTPESLMASMRVMPCSFGPWKV